MKKMKHLNCSFVFIVWISVFTGMTVSGVAFAQIATTTPQLNTTEWTFAPTKLFSQIFELSLGQLSHGATVTTTATTTVEIPPTAFPLTLEIRELPSDEMPVIAWASTTTSTVWHIDVKGPTNKIWLPTPFLIVTLPASGPFYLKKVIHFWDNNRNEWRPLQTETNFNNKTVSARYPLPYGRFIVRDHPMIYEGFASWYKWKNGDFAAFRHLPKRTKLKVTNISRSARHGKSVYVHVNDYGPEVWTERLIDLDYYAYKQIGIPRGGIMPVRVEIIK